MGICLGGQGVNVAPEQDGDECILAPGGVDVYHQRSQAPLRPSDALARLGPGDADRLLAGGGTMGLIDALVKLADPYDRQARLCPALLVLARIAVLVVCLYAPYLSLLANVVAVLLVCGAAFWLSGLARDPGKRLERGLFRIGARSPRSSCCDIVTKRSIH